MQTELKAEKMTATLKIPLETHRRLKVRASQENRRVGELATEFLEAGLKSKQKSK
jgi:plasmid stability protein